VKVNEFGFAQSLAFVVDGHGEQGEVLSFGTFVKAHMNLFAAHISGLRKPTMIAGIKEPFGSFSVYDFSSPREEFLLFSRNFSVTDFRIERMGLPALFKVRKALRHSKAAGSGRGFEGDDPLDDGAIVVDSPEDVPDGFDGVQSNEDGTVTAVPTATSSDSVNTRSYISISEQPALPPTTSTSQYNSGADIGLIDISELRGLI